MSERDTGEWYSTFAEVEALGQSAIYFDWAMGVAGDEGVQRVIERMPLQKRQPNLVFATSRLLGAPEGPWAGFRDWYLEHSDGVAAEAAHRMTQTNEPRRCASLMPALSLIPGPLALLEVGASAGLCLYPDRYSYRYSNGSSVDPLDGPSSVLLECVTSGDVPVPGTMPTVAWRAGIDLHPLSVLNADDMRWLETLVWPEQDDRRARLRAAIELAQQDPPLLLSLIHI